MSDRDAFREAREHGLKARHETREARAQTVIGQWDHQAIVQPCDGFVRLRVADDTGETYVAVMLPPEAAERLARILMQAKTIVEIGSRDPE